MNDVKILQEWERVEQKAEQFIAFFKESLEQCQNN